MEFNINAGRLVNPVELYSRGDGTDDYGQPLPLTLDFQAWADIDVKNGSQLVQMGETLTTELVTCLMYYDDRIKNSKWIKDVNADITYEIQHVRRSKRHQSMIITAKATDFTESIEPTPTTRFVPNFNGVDQYGVLPNINLQTNDVVSFDIISPTSTDTDIRMLLSSDEAYVTLVRINANSADLVTEGGPVTVDGVPATSLPLDGQQHTISLTLSRSRLLNLVVAQSAGGGSFLRFFDAPMFNLKVNDGSIYNFPMNEPWSEYPVMKNTGSGADGTYVNMTEESVIEIPL